MTAPSTATNYQVGTAGGTGRSTAPLLDTPQTITVIPQQIIREQASSTVMDALRNVPGITFRAGEGGNQGDAPYIRGFDARNDIFRDGVRDPGWYTRDSFAIDSVEVLKGPSSFMFGRGSTGGVINLNTKWPIFGAAPVPYTSGMPVKAPFRRERTIGGLRRTGPRPPIPDLASAPSSTPTSRSTRTPRPASR